MEAPDSFTDLAAMVVGAGDHDGASAYLGAVTGIRVYGKALSTKEHRECYKASGKQHDKHTYFIGEPGASCAEVCYGASMVTDVPATTTIIGQEAANGEQCTAVAALFGADGSTKDTAVCAVSGVGCFFDVVTGDVKRCVASATSLSASYASYQRYCACTGPTEGTVVNVGGFNGIGAAYTPQKKSLLYADGGDAQYAMDGQDKDTGRLPSPLSPVSLAVL